LDKNYFDYKYITEEKPITSSEIIQEQINDDVSSVFKISAYEGVKYYRSKNTNIKSRDTTNFLTDFNHKVANGFLKKIIDQKVNYLLGKKLIINNADNINEILNINKIIKKAAKEASKKAVEWLHPYIDKDGEFKVITISGLECIPIWDTEYETELQQMIRYYKIFVLDNNEKIERYKVEVYDKEKITYYMQDVKGDFYLDTSIEANPVYYINFNTTLGGSIVETKVNGWGKVPFVPLWNNEDRINDLEPIKEHIDLYDIVKSDWANNLDQIQDALLVLINRTIGDTKDEYNEFWNKLKQNKVIELDENGNASFLNLNLPTEAREKFLTLIRDDIFEFGQAVDTRRVADGNTTNVVIKSRYSDLDLKCDEFETMVENATIELCWFANKYLAMKNLPQDNLNDISITTNRNIIFNKGEMIDNFVKQGGKISNKTLLSTHPDVNDVEEEQLIIDEELQGFDNTINV
jgi:SPP1 family phage portal protein